MSLDQSYAGTSNKTLDNMGNSHNTTSNSNTTKMKLELNKTMAYVYEISCKQGILQS